MKKRFQLEILTFTHIKGKGPEKEKYEEKIKKLNLKRVAFRTMWLSPEDYPLLLGEQVFGSLIIQNFHLLSYSLILPFCFL